jgi:HK97 family phage prohead protease
MPEYKAGPAFTKSISDRTVVGLFAIHGNIDEGMDRSHPGSLAKTTINGRTRARFVWQHRTDEPPVAKIDQIREVTRAELPQTVLAYAPDATGGVEVTRTYLDTPRGSEILAGIKAGAIEEMSYAYDVIRFDEEVVEGRGRIRNLYEMSLYDISDVLWGMNPATVGSKGLPLELEHQAVLAAVDAHIKRYQALASLRAKEGRVLSGDNRKRIESAVEALAGATTALTELLAATEKPDPAKALPLWLEWQRLEASLGATAS